MKRIGDKIGQTVIWMTAAVIVLLMLLFLVMLTTESGLSIQRFSWRFLVTSTWDPVHLIFGALPFLYGTVVTSVFAIIFAGIVGIPSAVFLVYVAGNRLRTWLGALIELLAAIPSVVYGLWGLFVLVPWLQNTGEPFLAKTLGFLPLFRGMPVGVGYLAAGIILSIMILPTITSLTRDILLTVPNELHEGAYALGATSYEMIRSVVLPYARTGIIGALMLALGRAFGETIAVTMVIGNRPEISGSLFSPGYTMASVIANEFTEATSQIYLSSLYEVGLVLLIFTVVFYALARLLVARMMTYRKGGASE